MEKFELHNKIIQQLRFHRISGMDEEQCADNILSIVQTDWTEGCLCYEGDKTGETWCCNKCGKPTSTHTSHHPTLPSDEEIHDNAERVPNLNFDEEIGYVLGAKWMRSLCEAKIAEMEKYKSLVIELAEWSRKYPRDRIYSMRKIKMDDELIALENKAKELTTTP